MGSVLVVFSSPALSTASPVMLMMRPSVSLTTGIEIASAVAGRAPGNPIGSGHADAAHSALAQMLGHLEHELGGIGEHVGAARARNLQRIVDGRQLSGLELHVDDGTDHLDDLALAHVSIPFCARLTTLMPPATRPCLGSKFVCARLATLRF